MTTTSQKIASDVCAMLRARNPLIWVVSREEARVEGYLVQAAAAAGYPEVYSWDCGQGVCAMNGAVQDDIGGPDIGETLTAIRTRMQSPTSERTLFILRDLPVWLEGQMMAPTLRQLRNLMREIPGVARDNAQHIVVIAPTGNVPAEIAAQTSVIEWSLPDREEIGEMLDAAVAGIEGAAPNGTRDAAIDAAVGLTGEEVQACYAKSLVQTRSIDPAAVAAEKKRVVASGGLIEWFDPLPGGLDAVGGLDNLKSWLMSRSAAYSPAAREYGLPAPKGALLAGIPGCGKSLTAKAIATAWQVPLLKVDLGALKSKYVGESEGNLRKVWDIIAAIGRCVVWFDEVEKALQGATSGSADGGVSSDALGSILNWMQERQGEAFVIATANDAESLPPEFLRKGRFDEVWWIDLPTTAERGAILEATLRQFKRDELAIDIGEVAAKTATFTGSEVAAIVPDALYAAFADNGRDITTNDLLVAARSVVPLNKSADAKLAKLREWAAGRARPASIPEEETAAPKTSGRQLDI